MMTENTLARPAGADPVFVLRFAGNTYPCRLSQGALYELCRSQDPALDRIDAYLALKARIDQVVLRLIEKGMDTPPEVLEWEDVVATY